MARCGNVRTWQQGAAHVSFSAYEPGGRKFESCRAHQSAWKHRSRRRDLDAPAGCVPPADCLSV